MTVAVAALCAACGTNAGGGQAAATTGAPTAVPSDRKPPVGDTITGTLAGDAALEGGCVWVDAGGVKWQVQWPDGYTVSTDPIAVSGPGGVTIAEGDTVTVTGSEQKDAMTTCQVGPVWAATAVTTGG